MQFQGLYYYIVQIVVIQRDCNGLHGGFQFVLGQVALPNDEHLSAISYCHSIPLRHAGSLVPALR